MLDGNGDDNDDESDIFLSRFLRTVVYLDSCLTLVHTELIVLYYKATASHGFEAIAGLRCCGRQVGAQSQ